MSSRSNGPVDRPVTVALCMMAVAFVVAIICAATAHGANYKMLLCAGNNGSNSFDTATNTISPQHPSGIFSFENHCGPAPDPAGGSAFLRIAENQPDGAAGDSAYGSISWTVPPWVAILAGGGYTREPGDFGYGWRGRFWAEDFGGATNHILMQGAGMPNSDYRWAPTSVFASHLWPFSGYGYFRRFVFELTCMSQGGCYRGGFNAVDANTILLTLYDADDSRASFTDGSELMKGGWVRGTHAVTWTAFDQGSGLRWERLYVDGAERHAIDHGGACDLGHSGPNGEFARQFQPCPTGGPYSRSYALDTASVPDGARTIRVCAQDYAQAVGLDGTGSQSCDQRTVHLDNTAPGKPADLRVTSANPARYLDRFGARFSLPPNQGSPIAKVHYEVVNAAGQVVVPEQVHSATDPTSLSGIEGPQRAGEYTLRVRLEDQVGFVGPVAEAPVPHDTVPPAAPQGVRVVAPTTARRVERFGLRWQNVPDAGSPIVAAHYQVLDGSGEAVAATRTVAGENVEEVDGVPTPAAKDDYSVRVWLSDEEGNVGAAARVSVPRDGTPPAAPQDVSVAAPDVSRVGEGFDVRWRNVPDAGSPIVAAHYEIVNRDGAPVVPATTVTGQNIEAIADLDAPRDRGAYILRLWLSDAEGNVGAPASVPLAYECVRSETRTGALLSAGLGDEWSSYARVRQGQGSALVGRLRAPGGSVAGAAVCVFSRVLTDAEREFVGIALTDGDGGYRFALAAGPSRALDAVYRPGQRRIGASATLYTRVRPTLRARRHVVRNKRFARFYGWIPGPHNDRVVVVLQVKQAKGWRVFRRYRTRGGGRYRLIYRFGRTSAPATYLMRAQVRRQGGYPYLPGNSKVLRLRVMP